MLQKCGILFVVICTICLIVPDVAQYNAHYLDAPNTDTVQGASDGEITFATLWLYYSLICNVLVAVGALFGELWIGRVLDEQQSRHPSGAPDSYVRLEQRVESILPFLWALTKISCLLLGIGIVQYMSRDSSIVRWFAMVLFALACLCEVILPLFGIRW